MVILTAGPSSLDNILTLSLVGLLALIVLVAIVRKALSKKKAIKTTVEELPTPAPADPPKAPGSAGQLKLYTVEPKTAALLMAIVADRLQKPVNELRFISIKEVN